MTIDSYEEGKIQSILEKIASTGEYTEENLDLLRRAFISSGSSNVLQFGKYNIHINDGENIQIGDKTYLGPDIASFLQAVRQAQKEIVEDNSSHALQGYFQALRTFCNNFPYLSLDELLGRERKKLEEIYIPLRVRFHTDSIFSGKGYTRGITKETTVADALRQVKTSNTKHILILGDPGAGKSTLLRQIAQNSWDVPSSVGLDLPHFAIVVRLRSLVVTGGAHVGEMLLKASELVLLEQPPENFLTLWSTQMQASWLILLDGLDEVPIAQRSGLIQWVKDFTKSIGDQGHHVVITSRPIGDPARRLGEQFAVYELLPFSKPQQERFAQRWFKTEVEKFLLELDRMKTGELQGTPLLLTIAAAVYSADNRLPERRSSLYERFISIWLEEAKKWGLIEDLGERLSKLTRLGLEYFAHKGTQHPAEVSIIIFNRWARTFLQEAMGLPPSEADANSQDFVEVLSRRSGVFIRRGETCEWLHPTFREYLTAFFVVRECQDSPSRIWKRLALNWTEPSQKQIIIFALSIMSDNGQGVDYILERICKKGTVGLLFVVDALSEHIRANLETQELVVDKLKSLAKDERSTEREQLIAATALGRLGITNELLLLAKKNSISQDIKDDALDALIQIGLADDLLSLAQDAQVTDSVREKATELLAEQGYKEQALEYLYILGRNERINPHVRLRVAETLWDMGEQNNVLSIMQLLLQEKNLDDSFREYTVDSFIKMGFFVESVPLVVELALNRSNDMWNSWRTIGELERIEKCILHLERLERGAELMTLARYKRDYEELHKQNPERNVLRNKAFATRCEEIDKEMRIKAIDALIKLKKLDELLLVVQDSLVETELRRAIIKFFAELKEKDVLLSLMTDVRLDQWVRLRATQYLNVIGQGDLTLNFWLSALLTSPDETMQKTAADILGKLGWGNIAMRIVLLQLLQGRIKNLEQLLLVEFSNPEKLNAFPNRNLIDRVASLLLSFTHDKITSLQKMKEAISLLMSLVLNSSVNVEYRFRAIEQLERLEASRELMNLVQYQGRDDGLSNDINRWAVDALVRLGKLGELALIVQDNQVNIDIRDKILRFFVEFHEVEALLSIAKNLQLDSWVHKRASSYLYKAGWGKEILQFWLSLLLNTNDEKIRKIAADILGEVGDVGKIIRVVMLRLLLARIVSLAQHQPMELLSIGSANEHVSSIILAVLRDEKTSQDFRKSALKVMSKMGDADSLFALAEEKRSSVLVRKEIADVLMNLGQEDKAAEIWFMIARDKSLDKMFRKNAISSISLAGRNTDLVFWVESQQADKWARSYIKNILAHGQRRIKQQKGTTNKKMR